jgi:hypothetical protein
MLPLILICASFADDAVYSAQRQSLMEIPLSGSNGFVAACDMNRFRSHIEAAPDITGIIFHHKSLMSAEIRAWNNEDAYGSWERDIDTRLSAWRALSSLYYLGFERGTTYDTVETLHESGYTEIRYVSRRCTAREDIDAILGNLNSLRALIGDQNYLDGIMPPIFPSYRTKP